MFFCIIDKFSVLEGFFIIVNVILNLVELLWKFLKFDGGLKIIGYFIEMKDVKKFFWSKCGKI